MNESQVVSAVEASTGVALTPEGYASLQHELEHLTTVKRPEIAERIRESLQHGEFSEDNSELDEVKFEQAMVESRIAELKTIFGNAHVLEDGAIPTDHVGLGTRVTVSDLEYGDEFEVRVVSSVEADPSRDLISNESPMGTALLGHTPGEIVECETPDGKKKFKIVSVAH
ncbi:MAG TPA: transcription elongation factor GreA [Fimbriimonadaceae bacterium]|nr:transcription elongation factor GreA [Fimbriimonadaceae bacterium]